MTNRNYAGTEVEVDEQGYLTHSDQWTPSVGEAIAEEIGLNLTPEHWEVINFAREDFAEKGQSPGLRRISTSTTVNMKSLYRLFPKGPGKLIARVAGTPKPKSCL